MASLSITPGEDSKLLLHPLTYSITLLSPVSSYSFYHLLLLLFIFYFVPTFFYKSHTLETKDSTFKQTVSRTLLGILPSITVVANLLVMARVYLKQFIIDYFIML